MVICIGSTLTSMSIERLCCLYLNTSIVQRAGKARSSLEAHLGVGKL